jgi:hypothetical protein
MLEKENTQVPTVSTKQELSDKLILVARKKGKNALAGAIASMGEASPDLIKAEYLPELESKIESIEYCPENDLCQLYTVINDFLIFLDVYTIHPTDLVEKAISSFLNRKKHNFAARLARNGSAAGIAKIILENPESEGINEFVDLRRKEMGGKEMFSLLKKLGN